MESEGYIKTDRGSVFYQQIKRTDDPLAPTLVFLHDALGSVAQWKSFPLLLSLKTNLNALVIDRIGYGKSDPSTDNRTKDYLQLEAKEVLPRILSALKVKDPILIGHSDGGSIALIYAMTHKPYAVICEAAHAYIEEETLQGIRNAITQRDKLIDKLKKYHGDKTNTLFNQWATTWLKPEFRDWNIVRDLNKINCPVFILQGAQDEYATPDHINTIKKGIGKNASTYLIQNCGHIPHLEAESKTLSTITAFIQNKINTPTTLKKYHYE